MRALMAFVLALLLLVWALLIYLPAETNRRWFLKLILVEASLMGVVLAMLLALAVAPSRSWMILGLVAGLVLAQPWLATVAATRRAQQSMALALPLQSPDLGLEPSLLRVPWRPLVCAGVTIETYPYPTADSALALDVYRLSGSTRPRPWVFVIHGGAWRSGTRSEQSGFNCALARSGFVVVAADYRLAPAAIYPAQREDLESAIAWVQKQAEALGLATNEGHILGRSAGGQLALDLAYRSSQLQFRSVIAIYTPADMVFAGTAPFNREILDATQVLKDYLGATYAQDPAVYEQASPLLRVRPGLPPTLLLHGPHDGMVAYTHSERLHRALREQGVPSVLATLPWMEHGGDIVPWGPHAWASLALVADFLERSRRR